jgi:hypothetical protein
MGGQGRGAQGPLNDALDGCTPWAYSHAMLTVVETTLFQRQWPCYWTEDERGAFAAYIAEHPIAGDVVPGSGGIRKVRWGRVGKERLSCSRCMRSRKPTISPDPS